MFLSRWMLQMCISAFHKLICCVLNLMWLQSIFLHVTWSNFCCMQSADTRVDLWWGFLCEGWKLAREIADWMQMTWRAVSCGFSGEVITAICLTLFNFQGHFYCIWMPSVASWHPITVIPASSASIIRVILLWRFCTNFILVWDCWKHYRVHFFYLYQGVVE